MATGKGLQAFFEKRGFVVEKVIETDVGFAIWIDKPKEAREVFSSVADTTNLVFIGYKISIVQKRWWQKLLFWRK